MGQIFIPLIVILKGLVHPVDAIKGMVLQQVVQVECYPVKREYIVIKGVQRDNVGMGILPVVQMESVGVEVLLLGCVRTMEVPRTRRIFV